MKIVFDVYELVLGQGKSIGIYNYSKYLLHALAQIIDKGTEIIVLCNELNVLDFRVDHPAITTHVVFFKRPDKLSRILWFLGGAAFIARKYEANVYFSPKGFLPLGLKLLIPKIKNIIVVHDLIPLWYSDHFPGYFGRLEELYINTALMSGIKRADKVIAISKATADDIISRIGGSVDIRIVHNGLTIYPPEKQPLAYPYIFAMTSHHPHKNAKIILEAYEIYRSLVNYPLPIVICGIEHTNQDGVQSIKGLSNTDLHTYYAYARLFVFLSLTEGFGFPPLEALAHGTPVLCSDIAALKEIAKDHVNYVDPSNAELVAKRMAELLDDSTQPKKNAVNEYSWALCAKGVLNAIYS
jgi:glycosyltransferase involved in cell wall biosynthesis